MVYPKGYLDIQIKFAQRFAVFSGKSIEEELIDKTSLYKLFGIKDWDFNFKNLNWQRYLEFIKGEDLFESTYKYYLSIGEQESNKDEKVFGCFTYEIDTSDDSIQIHFRNNDNSGYGALSRQRIDQRRKELKEMLEYVKKNHPEIRQVFGFSWLHNIEAYKRLFPESYYISPKVYSDWFRSAGIWGQFLDGEGNIKEDMVKEFLNKIEKAGSLDELRKCFMYYVLEPSAPIEDFYRFYNLS